MIKFDDVKTYYESLSEERKLKAFYEMVDALNQDQQIRFNDEMKLYWTSCGEPI
jgi:hypothetical protein